jgi:hypothetical protein
LATAGQVPVAFGSSEGGKPAGAARRGLRARRVPSIPPGSGRAGLPDGSAACRGAGRREAGRAHLQLRPRTPRVLLPVSRSVRLLQPAETRACDARGSRGTDARSQLYGIRLLAREARYKRAPASHIRELAWVRADRPNPCTPLVGTLRTALRRIRGGTVQTPSTGPERQAARCWHPFAGAGPATRCDGPDRSERDCPPACRFPSPLTSSAASAAPPPTSCALASARRGRSTSVATPIRPRI